ncbi:MAG: DUF1080 domain-containing protein [Lentisphaeraceae bacterium]|nr:DUF1080 domain-containing protein [Lentisphaeraceae bacterium]
MTYRTLLKSITSIISYNIFLLAPIHAEEWQNLLDKDLSQWEVFVGVPHESVVIPGMPPSTSKNGTKGVPLGLNNDPLKTFTVIEEDGKPVLRVSGQIYAGLSTFNEYENYHFKCEFKWGDKKWEPRLNKLRDSGILYHANGKHGAFWNVWLSSLECQIQEGDCGDFIPLAGTSAKTTQRRVENRKRPFFDPSGKELEQANYVSHSPSEEKPHGKWNTVEIFTIGQQSVFVVNGTPNMVLYEATQKGPNGKGRIPLTSGRIQIQSEGAEAYYKNIEIKKIKKFPEHIEKMFIQSSSEMKK